MTGQGRGYSFYASSDSNRNVKNMYVAVKEQRQGTVDFRTRRLAETAPADCGGNVHVHESRREPDMSGCVPLSLKRYDI